MQREQGRELGGAPWAGPSQLTSAPAESPPAGPLVAGSRIDRYEILEVVGAGGTSTVYRVHDGSLGRDVSLKLLHATSRDPALRAEARRRLLHEAQALARLSHPNVVAAYDVGTHDGALFISMEFIEGSSMRDWLSQPRRQAEVLRVLIAAGRGLVAAHASGVLHRDFKPANVMVSSDGRVRVVDFGLAQEASQTTSAPLPHDLDPPRSGRARSASTAVSSPHTTTRTADIAGTPGYMPPEQWLGAALDHRVDQFGYAVTAFVALTGQKPYPEGVDPTELAALHRARTPWPRSVPRGLRRIIDRGLSLSPEDRYPSLAAMVRALERFASPQQARAGGSSARGGDPPRRRKCRHRVSAPRQFGSG